MNPDRRQVLDMLSTGRITPDEAERLLAALERATPPTPAPYNGETGSARRNKPKYLRVLVEADHGRNGPARVNIRVPMQLLRAGVRLSSLIPEEARVKVNAAMREKGVDMDIGKIRPENLEELIEQLDELTVDVDDDHAKVRIFAE